MVTSPVGTAHDWVAANFASALAALGLRVALVATTPRQAWFTNSGDDAPPESATRLTLPDLLARAQRGSLNGELTHDLVATDMANLVVVPPGGPDALDGTLDGLPPLLAAFSQAEFDVTVVAGPALLDDPAATIVAWSTRHVLWAVELGGVTEADAREAASRLQLAGVDAFGVALVGRQV